MLTPEQNQFFADMELLFASDGWKTLIETFKGFDDSLIAGALGSATVEDFWISKGRHSAFVQILNYEEFIDGLKKDMTDAAQEAADQDA